MNRRSNEKYTPTQAEMKRLMGDSSNSRDVNAGITRHDHTGREIGKPAPTKTADDIRAEARASVDADPNMREYYERKRAAQAEQVGMRVDSILLRERLVTEA